MFLFIMIYSNIGLMLNLPHLRKYFLRLYYFIKYRNKDKKVFLPQSELNKLFENPNFDVNKVYVRVLRYSYTAFFFSSIYPMGIFYTFVTLILFYWIT